ncbi:MAG: flagellar export protein FliJ [Bacillota bacterium]|nr:flagellar export protein FliJ [Bacillota bacterium]
MAFDFKLQKLLDYRDSQKSLAQEELSRRQRELLEIEEELKRLEHKSEQLLEFHRGRQVEKIDVFALMSIESYRTFLQERFRCKKQELGQSQEQVEKQRQHVVESWKGCQVLEKLKEKDLGRYTREENAKEQRFNDEISLYGYLRKEK